MKYLKNIIDNYNYQHKDKPVSIPRNNMELYKTYLYMQNNMTETELKELEKIELPKPTSLKELDLYRDCVDIYEAEVKVFEIKNGKWNFFDKNLEEAYYNLENPSVSDEKVLKFLRRMETYRLFGFAIMPEGEEKLDTSTTIHNKTLLDQIRGVINNTSMMGDSFYYVVFKKESFNISKKSNKRNHINGLKNSKTLLNIAEYEEIVMIEKGGVE